MANKNVLGIIITVIAGLVLAFSAWVSNSTISNRVAIAEIKTEVKSEFKGVQKTLDIHYGLLREIRDDQKKMCNKGLNHE